MADLQAILQQINQMIDGQAFARMLDYFPDKIQVSGTSLKCFCPVHHELAFRSLIVNLRNNSYKCMMKHCACFEGGSLVQFWSIWRQMEPVEAALDLVERLKLPIDVEMLRRLGTEYADKAAQALEAGDIAAARTMTDSALALDPKNLKLRLFSAQVREAEGLGDQAIEERLGVLDALLEAERLEDARRLLKLKTARSGGCSNARSRSPAWARTRRPWPQDWRAWRSEARGGNGADAIPR